MGKYRIEGALDLAFTIEIEAISDEDAKRRVKEAIKNTLNVTLYNAGIGVLVDGIKVYDVEKI